MDPPLCLDVFTREMEQLENPHLTYETLVLRLLKRVALSFHLPWSHVLEVSRQAPYLMDAALHQDLLHIWTLRAKQATLDEQLCVERILGRDHVRSSDLIKLASLLQKISDPPTVYAFFAMDGYQGEDPKKYIDLFRYEAKEARGKHVRAVRQLYRSGRVQTPPECRSYLESIFEGTGADSSDGYVASLQEQVAEVAEWRREQQTKKKRPMEAKEESVKKSAPGNP